MFHDSHCHINEESFADSIDSVLENMVKNDVRRCMMVAISLDDWKRSLKISHPDISFKRAIGVFPEYTDMDEETFARYYEFMKEADAVGEIGLDYYWYKDTKEKQKELFIRQIEIAKELDKPIIVHARDALQDTFDILKEHRCRGVLHCYSGSAEMAREFVKLGYYISIAGPVTFKNAREPKEVVKAIPLDHLLIETDSPYLTPHPFRGQRNEPANVIYTGRKIMEEIGIDEDSFLEQIDRNYIELFGR